MFTALKTAIVKALITEDAVIWLIKAALNSALKLAKNPEKREEVCGSLDFGGRLLSAAGDACKDGNVDEAEALAIKTKAVAFGQSIYNLIED